MIVIVRTLDKARKKTFIRSGRPDELRYHTTLVSTAYHDHRSTAGIGRALVGVLFRQDFAGWPMSFEIDLSGCRPPLIMVSSILFRGSTIEWVLRHAS
jgi:hypothetical protein